jgi:hypothetical protein
MNYFKAYLWLPTVTALLALAIYFIFKSGPTMTCIWGFAMALILFWIREKHTIFYGVTEVIAGLFILGQTYSNGRGAAAPSRASR